MLNRLQKRDESIEAASGCVIAAMSPAENSAPHRHGSIAVGRRSTPFDDLAQAFAGEHPSVPSGKRRKVRDGTGQLDTQRSGASSGLAVTDRAIGSKQLGTADLVGR